MSFKKYNKIHRLGKEETDGILIGTCYIQEKIDGANTSVWVEDGEIKKASRNNLLSGGFNGFCDYIDKHEGIKTLLSNNPGMRLYGEWLVPHTIRYNELAYRKFYMFDIELNGTLLPIDDVHELGRAFRIDTPQLFAVIKDPTEDAIREFVGKTSLGDIGEGVVIKNIDFVNKYGDTQYAKIVTEKFKEDNAIVFGGNNKRSESYGEMYIVNKYVTLPRVSKVMSKIQPTIDKRLDMEHIPRIINSVYHDMLTEEIWEIQKKIKKIDFKKLQTLVMKKAKQIYVDILNGITSVADKKDE